MADRDLRCVSLGAGLARPGYRLWQKPGASNLLLQLSRHEHEHRVDLADNPIMSPQALLTGNG
jgi:hypothetical protein